MGDPEYTEPEWFECCNVVGMLRFIHIRELQSDRKFRLLACALASTVIDWSAHPSHSRAINVAERFADRNASSEELTDAAADVAYPPEPWDAGQFVRAAVRSTLEESGLGALCMTLQCALTLANEQPEKVHWEAHAPLLRCIFGNPFRPATFDPAWRTSDVLALARGIYDERAFDRMPILADALQDAGCDSDDILSHCRDTNAPHARGCWVVDLVLNKS